MSFGGTGASAYARISGGGNMQARLYGCPWISRGMIAAINQKETEKSQF